MISVIDIYRLYGGLGESIANVAKLQFVWWICIASEAIGLAPEVGLQPALGLAMLTQLSVL